MELAVRTLSCSSSCKYLIDKVPTEFNFQVARIPDPVVSSSIDVKLQRRKASVIFYALPETAVSVAIAATVVGAAATLLVRRTTATEKNETPLKPCEDCGGSGICSECNGEGFVLKKLSEESAEKARMSAKNVATRYTAALPKKWSYCNKCSSTRSCITCGGRGKLSY